MIQHKIKTKNIWYKAAALGSIWASFEIVVGSFLHNVKFPLSGTILATLGVILMIAFAQIWKENGLFIRAGLIAALMKSISPSAILIGPMTGIFFEALLVEISLFVFRRNIFGYLIAGILALYSVLIHKVATLLILYGFDIVKITENLYFFLSKQLNIKNLGFYEALGILSLAYVGIGIFAAIIGYITGKKAKNNKFEANNVEFSTFKNNFLEIGDNQKYSARFLILHIIVIVGIFASINKLNLIFSSIVSLIYLLFCFLWYKRTYRHFKKIGFWIQIMIVLVFSILFYSGVQNISLLNEEGLLVGLAMIVRMLVLIVGFAAVSVELRNPFVKTLLFKNGFGNLYNSLGLAFSVLPGLMKLATNPKKMIKSPGKVIIDMIQNANSIYDSFVKSIQQRKVIIITGERGEGKSTFLLNLVTKLEEKNIPVGGFIARGHVKNGKRSGFDIVDIHTKQEMQLSSTQKIGNLQIGKFYFNQKAIEFGQKITEENYVKNDKFVIIDEIGPLELKNKGWSEVVEDIFNMPNKTQIWTVRKSLVKSVLKRFAISEAIIFDIKKDDLKNIVTKLTD